MSAGAGARRLARIQSASVAVTATVVALVATVGVTAALVRRDPAPADRFLATPISGESADAADVSTARSDAARSRPERPAAAGTGDVATPADGPQPEPAVAGAAPDAAGTGGSVAPARDNVGATGAERAPDAGGVKLNLRAPQPGRWRASTTVTTDAGVLSGEQRRSDAEVIVSAPVGATRAQDVSSEPQVLSVALERIRDDRTGRRLERVDVAPTSDEVLTFEADDGFLVVPASMRRGQEWSWSATTADRRTSLDAVIRTVGLERVTHDGVVTDVLEYSVVLRLGGDRAMTIERRVWHGVEIGLPIRVEERTRGTTPSGQTVDRSAVLELEGASPEADADTRGGPPAGPPPSQPPPSTTTTQPKP